MAIRAVIFDFFGTLTCGTPAAVWGEHAARSAAPLGIPADRWHHAFYESWPERATGGLGDLSATLQALARRCGVNPEPDALADACAARLACQRELIHNLRHDTVSTLRSLRARHVPVGVLSDCSTELVDVWPSLPIAELVIARVLSCEEGRRKPDPELYRLAAHRLSVPPSECLYLGDGGGYELTGAAAAGMTSYMLRETDWADNDARDREDDWAGPSLTGLAEVLPLVGLSLPAPGLNDARLMAGSSGRPANVIIAAVPANPVPRRQACRRRRSSTAESRGIHSFGRRPPLSVLLISAIGDQHHPVANGGMHWTVTSRSASRPWRMRAFRSPSCAGRRRGCSQWVVRLQNWRGA